MESMVTREQIQGLADEIKEYLHAGEPEDLKLVQKGMMLYRQGLVTQLQISDGALTATVQDVTPAHVRLDFMFLAGSHCTCPGEGLCRHQLAVFFSAYAKVASIADWMEEWREPLSMKKEAAVWGLERAKDLMKANRVLAPDYDRWVQSFEASFATLLASKKYTSPYALTELFGIYQRRLSASAPVEQEWRLLYELIAAVMSLQMLAKLSDRLGHDPGTVHRTYHHLFHNLLDEVEDLTKKISVQALPFAFHEFIVKLKQDTFGLLTCTTGLENERIYMYQVLWRGLFKKKDWMEEEIVRIREAVKQLEDGDIPLPLMLAAIHMYFLLEDDDLALELIGNNEDYIIAPYMVYWIDDLTELKSWKRALPYIELFLQKGRGYLQELGEYRGCSVFTRNLLRTITPYCAENNRLDLYERALVATLPYSFPDYEYMLFERGQYDRWGELQALVGLDFYDLPKDRVKVIEKERPEVLLGMLHQTAQREINQKNRASYRMAVKHLKKLRTLYKKLKRVDDWEYFIKELLERTKRLRAFHEECQRSKLI